MVNDYQRVLFPYAYNILGSAEDARDAIQDVLSNFVTTKREGIDHEKNYLIKSVVNRSINIRNRRRKTTSSETVWLPEPLATEEADTNINLRDIVSYSMLYLLEQLTPKERAAFILKESFDYSHEEIADVLSGTVEGSRKLLSRAKQKLNTTRVLTKPATEKSSATLLEQYVNAIRGRDTKTLESLLTLDIAFQADGGDTVSVMKKLCYGSTAVAELLLAVYDKYQTTYTVQTTVVNHQPALLYFEGTTLRACQVFDIQDNKIRQIHTVVDPDKLVNSTKSVSP